MKKASVLFLVIILGQNLLWSADQDLELLVKDKIRAYFFKAFKASPEAFTFKFKRFPKDLSDTGNYDQINVVSQRSKIRLGYQTLWIEILLDQHLVSKFPVSVEAGLMVRVPVASHKLARQQNITDSDYILEERLILADWPDIIFADVIWLKPFLKAYFANSFISSSLTKLTPSLSIIATLMYFPPENISRSLADFIARIIS